MSVRRWQITFALNAESNHKIRKVLAVKQRFSPVDVVSAMMESAVANSVADVGWQIAILCESKRQSGIVASISIYVFSFSLCFRLATHVDAFGDVTYALVGDHSKHFSIDSISGTITVQNSTFLDRERQTEATFSVVGADKAPISSRRSAIVPVRVAHRRQPSSHKQLAQINSQHLPLSRSQLTILIFGLFDRCT